MFSGLLVTLFLFSLFQGVFATSPEKNTTDDVLLSMAPINPDYISYKEKQEKMSWSAIGYELNSLGYVPETIDLKHLKGKKLPKNAFSTAVSAVESVEPADTIDAVSDATFDLRAAGKVSPVKNQGSCGSCWAFASYGSLESTELPTELWDFSENNMINTAGFDFGPCSGGNHQISTAYLARGSGPVLESEDPYGSISLSGLSPTTHVQDVLFLPDRAGSLDNDNIKTALQTYGAVYTTMTMAQYTAYDYTNKTHYYTGTSAANHAVTIVGWDDNFNRYKFLTTPPGNGAFIVKNSWGTSFGDNGYFYVSYYDVNIGKYNTVFTTESTNAYDTIYQYDPLGWITSTGFNSDTGWFANVFVSSGEENLQAVSFYTAEVESNYQISIYLDPDNGPVRSTGPVLQTQGTISIPGYHTISLPSSVSLSQGQRFSVVVRLQTPNYEYPIPVEYPWSRYASKATAEAGQSYISRDGRSWTDLTKSMPNTNACLKAFTTLKATPTLTASFSATPTTGTSPLTVQFRDLSSGTPTSWLWNFGDSTTSILQHPLHQYTRAGTYTVSLTVTYGQGSDTLTKQSYITVTIPPPKADFTASPTSGAMPLKVQFTDISANNPTSWLWTFGDGTTSTLQHPAYEYTSAGAYTVSLTATNAGGSNTVTRSGLIVVTTPPAPKANFTATPTGGISPLTVQFIDRSTGTPASWKWTFGDGGISALQNPSYQYKNPGTYTVSLTVTNAGGSDTISQNNLIIVQVPVYPPKANFTAVPTSGLAPLTVHFNDTSTNSPTSWLWTFGDNTTSSLQHPSHQYANAGVYTVSLTSTNTAGENTITRVQLITVTSPPPPTAAFTGNPTSGTAPFKVMFTDQSTGNPISWMWTFGDGTTSTSQNPSHTYSSAGTYTVQLKVTNLVGSNTISKVNYIAVTEPVYPPVASFTLTPAIGTAPLTVQFTDTSTNSPTSWLWTFGDGTTSTLQHPSHKYTTPGIYTVSLTATNTAGSTTVTKQNSIMVTMPDPIASFTATPTSGTAPFIVQFTDTSSNGPTSWKWTFGDGTTSTLQHPSHEYTSEGTYTVSLTATNAGGSNTVTRSNYITVSPPVEPIIVDFSSDTRSGTYPLRIQFFDKSSGSPDSWLWDFGDSTISIMQSPSHDYQNAGMYTVTLVAKNDKTGGENVKKFYIKVYKPKIIRNVKVSENSKNYIQIT